MGGASAWGGPSIISSPAICPPFCPHAWGGAFQLACPARRGGALPPHLGRGRLWKSGWPGLPGEGPSPLGGAPLRMAGRAVSPVLPRLAGGRERRLGDGWLAGMGAPGPWCVFRLAVFKKTADAPEAGTPSRRGRQGPLPRRQAHAQPCEEPFGGCACQHARSDQAQPWIRPSVLGAGRGGPATRPVRGKAADAFPAPPEEPRLMRGKRGGRERAAGAAAPCRHQSPASRHGPSTKGLPLPCSFSMRRARVHSHWSTGYILSHASISCRCWRLIR